MSKWEHRQDTRSGDMAHGITFDMWERSMKNCRGEAAYDDKKFHLDGKVSLTLAQNQYKYGDELIAQVYGTDGVFRQRRAGRYSRVQVYLGKADLDTAEALEDIARTIRQKAAEENQQ
jgi:hypothetical protein